MRICYLSGVNSPHTKKWCSFFAELGHDVHLISFDKGEIENITVHHLNTGVGSESKQWSKITYLFQRKKIKDLICNIQPDILHAHRLTGYAYLGAQSGYHPYFLSVWGSDVFDFPYVSPLHKQFVKYNLSKADYIFSTSHVMKKQIGSFTKKPIEVTPFGVDLSIFKPRPSQDSQSDNPVIFGTIKTLEKKYGIEYLIRAFKILSEKLPSENIQLFIAGRGSQKTYLEDLVNKLNLNKKVNFAGYLNGQEVIKAYKRLDIAVFPSIMDSESFGVSAVEAQACGIPVIASNVGGLPEATLPDVSAIIVEPKDINMLVHAMEKLLKCPTLRMKMGEAGRRFVEENYNIKDNFLSVEKRYYTFKKSETF
jgi:L-malate glycosyltransferase